MKPIYIIQFTDEDATLEMVGGKGASLSRMISQDIPVPDGFHVTTEAYRRFISQNGIQQKILSSLREVDESKPSTMERASQSIRELFEQASMPTDVAEAVIEAYRNLGDGRSPVAVRSSATAEDQPDFSFAGQQESFLNIEGQDELLEALKKCWASLWTGRAIGYRYKNKIAPESLAMAVVVQTLVDAESSGILFTANPVTGVMDEVYINAGWGLGEAIVGGAVTPDTLIVDKNSWKIIKREISQKNVMSARAEHGTQEQPVPDKLRSEPVLDDTTAHQLAQISVQVEKLYDQPMDIEWAVANGQIAILQARPITTLPEPSAPLPGDWELPNPKGQYMRTSIVDFMPNPLSPLFRTLGLSSLNPALQGLIEWIGKTEAEDMLEDLFVTINGYVYFRAHFTRREWVWMVVRMLPNFPRMLREGIPYWREVARPEYLHVAQKWESKDLEELSASELLSGVKEIQDAAFKLVGSLMAGTLGAAAGSEGLFTNIYNKFIKREGDPEATAFLMGYNSTPIKAEKSLFDLADWAQEQSELKYKLLEISVQVLENAIKQDTLPEGLETETWRAFVDGFEAHIDQYGHIIYDLDYANPLPADDPSPMLNTLKMYLRGEGKNPHERQANLEEHRKESVRDARERLGGLRLWAFNKSLSWAQRQAKVREDSIADIGLGYPQLRAMLLELGSRISEAGGIQEANQIFWLQKDEIENMIPTLEENKSIQDKTNLVEERLMQWRAANRVTPPPMLPAKDKYLGFSADTWLSAAEEDQIGNILNGVPASSGNVTGKARVLHNPQEFDLMQPGEILVAEITTPAWTPLFAMASGVVTDVGGPLSHGSIVAREYGIPAVLGTGVATKRIYSGQNITVDGSAGTVELLGDN